MRAELRLIFVAGSANPSGGRLHRSGSARPVIVVASWTGPAPDGKALSALRSCAIELDLFARAGSRSLATSIPCGIDAAVRGHIASGTASHVYCAIAARRSISSPALHPSIGHDHLRPVDPARPPRRLTNRQLTPAT